MAHKNQSSRPLSQSKSPKSNSGDRAEDHGRSADSGAKVGESAQAAARVGGKGDFGVRESDAVERTYASNATKHQDKGAGVSHSGEDGARTSGVGGNASGVGSSSGGDVDTDLIGVGTGGSTVSASGIVGRPPGPDDSDGSSDEFASPVPKDRAVKTIKGRGGQHGPAKMDGGSTVDRSGGDASTSGDGRGTSAVTNPSARNDDSFAAEISDDEAAGADNSMSDNA